MTAASARSQASTAVGETLAATGVVVAFSGVRAIDGVDLTLQRGEILGLIGPNGAGKTTLVNVLSGLQEPTAGSVTIDGRERTTWSPQRMATAGVARTFQGARLFAGLSVAENVAVAALGVGASGRDAERLADQLLGRFGLLARRDLPAAVLPHGEERKAGIARALAMRPRFLLLDEPAAGLNEEESAELGAVLTEVRHEFGVGMLVIEHDLRLIMRLCERIQVLDHGRTIAVGTPDQVRTDPEVVRAYIGTGRDAAEG
jgi:branched-chain amino acid transport system ATP-binding protein